MRALLCGVPLDRLSFEQVVDKLISRICSNLNPVYVVTPNVQHVVMFQQDREFQKVYDQAFLSVPDGVPLLWAARLMNTPLKGRVNGTDLVDELCKVSAQKKFKVFFLGGRPKAANKAASIMRQKYSQLEIVDTYCPPYNFEQNRAEITKTVQIIKTAKPDILFVGLGAPKQEKWMRTFHHQLEVPVSIGIGGSFELLSGMVNRAPKWMQQSGLEWLFRLMAEPRRLWKRYLISNTVFVWLIIKQKISLISSKH
jgi:N-acetylglucosaminyldiphosphoundecaprenol N-acetyl-beta-D-mannosaminyltransferase